MGMLQIWGCLGTRFPLFHLGITQKSQKTAVLHNFPIVPPTLHLFLSIFLGYILQVDIPPICGHTNSVVLARNFVSILKKLFTEKHEGVVNPPPPPPLGMRRVKLRVGELLSVEKANKYLGIFKACRFCKGYQHQ